MNWRHDHFDPLIHPSTRLFWGLGTMVVFFFLESTVLLAGFLGLFALLGKLSGKRISFLYFGFFIASITAFGLLAPEGEVFASIGPWNLTWGALESGLHRGLSLTGMIFISLASISPKLRLPGILGEMLSRVFYYFHSLLREKKSLRPDHLWEDVDALLDRVWRDKPGPLPPPDHGTRKVGWVIMVGVLLLLVCAVVWERGFLWF